MRDERNARSPRVLIIGVGNDFRGDDAVGLIVARRLKTETQDKFAVVEETGEGKILTDSWRGMQLVILIDAVHSGAEPGKIHRFDALTQAEGVRGKFLRFSTHAMTVSEAIELARTLRQLPRRLILYGIEGEKYDVGAPLSRQVEEAAREVVKRVVQDVLDITS